MRTRDRSRPSNQRTDASLLHQAPGPDQQTTAVAVVVGVIVICCGAYAIYWIRENVTPG